MTLSLLPQEAHPMAHPAPNRRQVDTGQLWRWVDRLTRDRRHKLVRQIPGTRPRTEWVDVPAVWTQLAEALASSNSGGGRGKATTGSRSPLDLEIEALMLEVERDVVTALRQLGATARVRHNPTAARLRHDTRSDLRQLATAVVATGDQQLVDHWAGRYRTWLHRAETTLTADDENVDMHGVRGHACPVCLALWVASERDGERFRDPALVIAFRDGQVQHITCRACGTGWWRGADVDELTQQLTRNETTHGPAGRWGRTVARP